MGKDLLRCILLTLLYLKHSDIIIHLEELKQDLLGV